MKNFRPKGPEFKEGKEISRHDRESLERLRLQLRGTSAWIHQHFKNSFARLVDAVKNRLPEKELTKIKEELVELVENSAVGQPIFILSDDRVKTGFKGFCKSRGVDIENLRLAQDLKNRNYLNYPTFQISDWLQEISSALMAVDDFLKNHSKVP